MRFPPLAIRRETFCAALLLFGFLVGSLLSAAEAPKRRFNLPADAAEKTLKLFSEQSGRGLIAASELVAGVRTNPVQGEFTAQQALERMLSGTGLVAAADEQSGSFTVRREAPGPNAPRAAPTASDRPARNATAARATTAGDELVQLNPFVVATDTDRGYVSTNTLSGTRTNTPVKDLAIPISIVNRQYLDDVNAQSLNEALGFSASFDTAEVKIRGQIAGGNGTTARNGVGVNGDVVDSMASTERVEIFKGPSSIVNGQANPGGYINIVPKMAGWKNRGRANLQYGSFDRKYFLVDYNYVLTPRFAVRGVYNIIRQGESEWEQDTPTENKTYFFTSTLKLWKGAEVITEYEYGMNLRTLTGVDAIGSTLAVTGGQVPLHYQYNVPRDFTYGGRGNTEINRRHTPTATINQVFNDHLSASLKYSFMNRHQFTTQAATSVQAGGNPDSPIDPTLGRRAAEVRRSWNYVDRNEVYHDIGATLFSKFATGPIHHAFTAFGRMNWFNTDFTTYRHRLDQTPTVDIFEWFPLEAYRNTPERFYTINTAQPELRYVFQGNDDTNREEKTLNLAYQGAVNTRVGKFIGAYGVSKSWLFNHTGGSTRSGNLIVPRVIAVPDVSRDTTWRPSFSVQYQPNDAWSIYVAQNRSYTITRGTNSFGEFLPNPYGDSREIGVKMDAFDRRVTGTVGVFRTRSFNRSLGINDYPVKNAVLRDGTVVLTPADAKKWDAVTNPIVGGAGRETIAVGEYLSEGFDADVNFTLFGRWTTTLTYTFSDARTVADTDPNNLGRREGNDATYHTGVLTRYDFGREVSTLKGLSLGAGYRRSSGRVDSYQLIAGRSVLYTRDGVNQLDVFAKYRFKLFERDTYVQANVRNLLREDRQTGFIPPTLTTGERVRYRFERPIETRVTFNVDF